MASAGPRPSAPLAERRPLATSLIVPSPPPAATRSNPRRLDSSASRAASPASQVTRTSIRCPLARSVATAVRTAGFCACFPWRTSRIALMCGPYAFQLPTARTEETSPDSVSPHPGSVGDERVTRVGLDLDRQLETALRQAIGGNQAVQERR